MWCWIRVFKLSHLCKWAGGHQNASWNQREKDVYQTSTTNHLTRQLTDPDHISPNPQIPHHRKSFLGGFPLPPTTCLLGCFYFTWKKPPYNSSRKVTYQNPATNPIKSSCLKSCDPKLVAEPSWVQEFSSKILGILLKTLLRRKISLEPLGAAGN